MNGGLNSYNQILTCLRITGLTARFFLRKNPAAAFHERCDNRIEFESRPPKTIQNIQAALWFISKTIKNSLFYD